MKNVILFIACLLVMVSSHLEAQEAPNRAERTLFFSCSPAGFCSDVGFERKTECDANARDFNRCYARTVQSAPIYVSSHFGTPVLATTTISSVAQGIPVTSGTIAPVTQSLVPHSTITETSLINPGVIPYAPPAPVHVYAPAGQPTPSPVVQGPVSNFVTATNDSGPLRTGAPILGVR